MKAAMKAGTVALAALVLLVSAAVLNLRGTAADDPGRRALAAGASSSALLRPLVPAGSLDASIAALQDRLRAVPEDWRGYASLGLAYVTQARVTADPSWYPKAEGVLQTSLRLHAQDNVEAQLGLGALALARHDFAGALERGRAAEQIDPYDADVYGVEGDALLELGRYDEAFATFQTMVDTRPDIASYARASYARELLGNVPGAIEAMRQAFDAAGTPADAAWAAYQLGELEFGRGAVGPSAEWYHRGLELAPAYVPNLAGLAKVAWARGADDLAIRRYTQVVAAYPSVEYVTALGDLYASTGREDLARQQYAVVEATRAIARANGVERRSRGRALRRRSRRPALGARRRARRVGPPAEHPRGRRVRVGAARQREGRGRGPHDAQRAPARHAERELPLPRGHDRAGARTRRRGAPLPPRGARHQPALLDPARDRRRSRPRRARGEPMRRALLLLGMVGAMLLAPAAATAHPLGNFTVNTYAGIELSPGAVRVDYVLDMAEIPTVQAMPALDADGDGTVSSAEGASWAADRASELLAGVTLTVDGANVTLHVSGARLELLPGQGGLSILRMEATFDGSTASRGELSFRDANDLDRIGWHEVTAAGVDGVALRGSSVPAASPSDRLRSYPRDLLSSPLDVREADLRFAPGRSVRRPVDHRCRGLARRGPAWRGVRSRTWSSAPARSCSSRSCSPSRSGRLHALGPGHGKTLMGAYLVGAGGRARVAVAVGGAVAVMHTASVLALGFVVMTATTVFAPERVYPWLGLASGLIALGLGAALLVARLGSWGDRGPEPRRRRGRTRARPRTIIRTAATTIRIRTRRRSPARCCRGGGSPRSPSPGGSCRPRPRSSCCSRRSRCTGSATVSR